MIAGEMLVPICFGKLVSVYTKRGGSSAARSFVVNTHLFERVALFKHHISVTKLHLTCAMHFAPMY